MEIQTIITNLIKLLDNGFIWIYIAIFFVVMYLLISLLTWSFLKPLKYLGIPTFISGCLFLIIRSLSGIIANLLASQIKIIGTLMPSLLKPILLTGLGAALLGVLMIVIYIVINSKLKKKTINVVEKPVEQTPVVSN